MRDLAYIFVFICFCHCGFAQHYFNGYINTEQWQGDVYLSIIEDYRTLKTIDNEQIISKTSVDHTGFFKFSGNQLDTEHRIYKLHVDNCDVYSQDSNHFNGHCSDSKDILFIAKNTDSISFPLSFDAEMFCDIKSTNLKTSTFIRIDSIKEEMKFAYSEYRSKANRELNNKKWFKTLQDFGIGLNEPLAELYIYTFLSDRSSSFHDYYLKDLEVNTYYDNLLKRLKKTYPNSPYTKQYEAEITSDKFIATPDRDTTTANWMHILSGVLLASLILNFWFIYRDKTKNKKKHLQIKDQLTKQEQKVLDLILQAYSNKEIAGALFVSVSTVKTHVNNIYKKLNVNSRDEIKSLTNNKL
ncbi:regulatory LuxR family protein [Jejuia pallidilutea]|uniref:Regulatory LuxR family protein n=1 Tax=Jejuia pallidilutea TaxID=504487 RepID=A0A362X1N2_9FLAO|nr:helix-turn-helix transcriptional regulator [Jejuia pallidilutea]PQV47252.1 regulatory LuxR family protein [Jejuia pallidilutea]